MNTRHSICLLPALTASAPEFHGEPFKRHWIYGVYDGRVIFYEEMVALAFLQTLPDACVDLKTPDAVGLTGYYPTRSCIRYASDADEYTISMEGFTMREESPPQPISGEPRP